MLAKAAASPLQQLKDPRGKGREKGLETRGTLGVEHGDARTHLEIQMQAQKSPAFPNDKLRYFWDFVVRNIEGCSCTFSSYFFSPAAHSLAC